MSEELVIWWTSQAEATSITYGDLDALPIEIRREVWSRIGRNGRGRLWPISGLELPNVEEWPRSSLGHYLGEYCGGIVIPKANIKDVRHLPGTLTDFKLERLS